MNILLKVLFKKISNSLRKYHLSTQIQNFVRVGFYNVIKSIVGLYSHY